MTTSTQTQDTLQSLQARMFELFKTVEDESSQYYTEDVRSLRQHCFSRTLQECQDSIGRFAALNSITDAELERLVSQNCQLGFIR